MASEAIKRMLLKQMFEHQDRKEAEKRAQKIAEKTPELFGLPERQELAPPQIDAQTPGDAFMPGMATEETVPGTGLYNPNLTPREQFTGFNQRLMASGMPSLQGQALQNLSGMQRQGMGQGPSTKSYAPVTIVNDAGDKRLVVPTYNPTTGQAELNPMDMPAGFRVSTETPWEKRQADVTAAGERKRETIKQSGLAGRQQDVISKGLTSADALPNVNRGLDLLNSVETGGFDAAALKAKRLFGIESADEAELSNRMGKAVLSQLRQTFGAAFTAQEGKQLQDIEAGFGKSTEGNKRLLEQAKRILSRAAKRGIRAARKAGDEETAREIEDAMNFRIGGGQEAGPPEGTSATNPQTGQRIIYQNGQWQPAP